MSTQSDPKLKAISINDVENILETNKTITPLGIGGVFTSEWFNSEGYVSLNALINTDAVGKLYFDYSIDGIVVDYTKLMPVPALVGVINTTPIVSSFIRVRYENGEVAQTIFRLSYTLTDKARGNVASTNQTIYEGDDTSLVRIANNVEVDIALGRIANQSTNFLFGSNPLITTTPEDIWQVGGTYNWLSAPTTLEVLSSDINDDVAGLGAQVVVILGLDANFDEILEVVLLNGSVSNPTTQLFLRVNRAVVIQAGTLRGANFDDLTIQASGGGVVLAFIGGVGANNSDYGYGISQLGLFTIPRNKDFIVEDITLNVSGGKVATINAFGLTNPTVLGSAKTLLFTLNQFQGVFRAGKNTYDRIAPMTDIWFSAFTEVSTSAIDIRLYYKLVDVIP